MLNIDIIGVVDNEQHYDIETIQNLLLLGSETLVISNEFVCRPGHAFMPVTPMLSKSALRLISIAINHAA